MSISAIRASVRAIVENQMPGDHPGLTLYRYPLAIDEGSNHQEKEKVIQHLVHHLPSNTLSVYKTAFARWENWLESGSPWCRSCTMESSNRLFIGLGGASVLEFGVTLHHVYGLPMIPGSSLKGLCAAYADEVWGTAEEGWKLGNELHRIIFGNPEIDNQTPASAGAVDFLDAWWKPSGKNPFQPEIINPHHPKYYVRSGESDPPADWDSPIPVKLLAVSGSFLFGVRGPAYWNDLVLNLLVDALCDWGVGGKTRAGYGRFKRSKEMERKENLEIWDATLTFTPNDGILTATNEKNERAILKGGKEKADEFVPKEYHNRLWGRRRKAIKAKVEVERVGNSITITKVFEP
jgi:CRISPR-associated protein Cmr6